MTNRERMARWRKSQKEKGICVICSDTVCSSSSIYCKSCKDKQRNRQDLRKHQGVCRSCDKKVGPSSVVYCEECLVHVREKARIAASKRPKREPTSTIRGKYSALKSKAKSRGIVFDIENEWFSDWYTLSDKKCNYCGVEEKTLIAADRSKSCLTIDRKNNLIGYTKENICLACFRCNNMKSNFFTAEEWLEIANRYIKPRIIEYHKHT